MNKTLCTKDVGEPSFCLITNHTLHYEDLIYPSCFNFLAGPRGFEPLIVVLETTVIPLNYGPMS